MSDEEITNIDLPGLDTPQFKLFNINNVKYRCERIEEESNENSSSNDNNGSDEANKNETVEEMLKKIIDQTKCPPSVVNIIQVCCDKECNESKKKVDIVTAKNCSESTESKKSSSNLSKKSSSSLAAKSQSHLSATKSTLEQQPTSSSSEELGSVHGSVNASVSIHESQRQPSLSSHSQQHISSSSSSQNIDCSDSHKSHHSIHEHRSEHQLQEETRVGSSSSGESLALNQEIDCSHASLSTSGSGSKHGFNQSIDCSQGSLSHVSIKNIVHDSTETKSTLNQQNIDCSNLSSSGSKVDFNQNIDCSKESLSHLSIKNNINNGLQTSFVSEHKPKTPSIHLSIDNNLKNPSIANQTNSIVFQTNTPQPAPQQPTISTHSLIDKVADEINNKRQHQSVHSIAKETKKCAETDELERAKAILKQLQDQQAQLQQQQQQQGKPVYVLTKVTKHIVTNVRTEKVCV